MSTRHALSAASTGLAPLPALVLTIGLASLALTASPITGQEVFFGTGSSLYETDEFCIDPDAALTDYQVGVSGDAFGASATYDSGSWPWPKPPGSGSGGNQHLIDPPTVITQQQQQDTDIYMSRGSAIQAVAEVYPLGALPGLREATATLRRYVKPFIGVGFQVSRDGESSTERTFDTYAVQGATEPLVAYGASLRVPLGDGGFGLQVQFRGTSLFSGGSDLEGPDGDTITTESETLTWATWLVGFSVGL